MKAFFQKQWPYLVHLGASALVFLDPAVQQYSAGHPVYSLLILAVWGKLLHWAQSPISAPASKF